MEDIILRQRQEVTALGVTRVRELTVQGYIDQAGVFRLKRCIGRYGPRKPSNAAPSAAAKPAA